MTPREPLERLSFGTKLSYGIGQVAEGIKTRGFDVFLEGLDRRRHATCAAATAR